MGNNSTAKLIIMGTPKCCNKHRHVEQDSQRSWMTLPKHPYSDGLEMAVKILRRHLAAQGLLRMTARGEINE